MAATTNKGASGDDRTSRRRAGAVVSPFRFRRRLRGKPAAYARNRRPAVSPDQLVGKWGFAAYHKDEDRARTIKEAAAQCNRPYVIDKGPTGGVMMNLADQKELSELVLKAGPTGQTYLGPPGAAGTALTIASSPMSMRTRSRRFGSIPDNASRYGTSVYVRCGKR